MDIMSLPSLGPYVGISYDRTVVFHQDDESITRTFRLLIYGAFNALGLIGSECNGIVILDVDQLVVLCDEIAKISSGYFGPDVVQIKTFNELAESSWDEFREFVNTHPRSRGTLDEAGAITPREYQGG